MYALLSNILLGKITVELTFSAVESVSIPYPLFHFLSFFPLSFALLSFRVRGGTTNL